MENVDSEYIVSFAKKKNPHSFSIGEEFVTSFSFFWADLGGIVNENTPFANCILKWLKEHCLKPWNQRNIFSEKIRLAFFCSKKNYEPAKKNILLNWNGRFSEKAWWKKNEMKKIVLINERPTTLGMNEFQYISTKKN